MPFMCKIQFKNKLPEIPGDPKMLVSQLEPDKLAKFFISTLETEPKKDLIFPPDLGVHISMFDLDQFDAPAKPPPMDPADQVLMVEAGHKGPQTKSIRHTNVSWLMRTQYVTQPDACKGWEVPQGAWLVPSSRLS